MSGSGKRISDMIQCPLQRSAGRHCTHSPQKRVRSMLKSTGHETAAEGAVRSARAHSAWREERDDGRKKVQRLFFSPLLPAALSLSLPLAATRHTRSADHAMQKAQGVQVGRGVGRLST